MWGTGIEKEVEICATIVTNKTKCMSTSVMKWGENCDDVSITSAICGAKP
jgi:hypothetical protein